MAAALARVREELGSGSASKENRSGTGGGSSSRRRKRPQPTSTLAFWDGSSCDAASPPDPGFTAAGNFDYFTAEGYFLAQLAAESTPRELAPASVDDLVHQTMLAEIAARQAGIEM